MPTEAITRTMKDQTVRPLTLMICGSALCTFVNGCADPRQPPVNEFLAECAGPSAVDCGRLRALDALDADVEKAMACSATARNQRKAFFVINEDETFDSQIASGFVSKSDGNVMLFYYDSALCGGPQCRSSFSLKGCPEPRAKKEHHMVKMVCE